MVSTSDSTPDAATAGPADWTGRVAVITGVARAGQAGETIADVFAAAGASVAILDRERTELEARAAELRERHPGQRITAHPCDLTDPASVAEAVAAVRAAHGEAVHALVNAAGGFAMSGEVAASDPAVWHRMLAINLTTAYLATRGFLPLLRAGRGAICYFGSVAALPGGTSAGMSAYAAAKAGVLSLVRSVAEEERANGVRANAIAPTAIRTRANEEAMGRDAAYVEREDVARLALWLCSPAARNVTGQVLRAE